MGDTYAPYSWAREIVPELLWIGLLHRGFGLRKGVEFASKLALAADRVYSADTKPLFCKITSFKVLNENQKRSVRDEISALRDFDTATESLAALFFLVPKSPLAFLSETSSDIDHATASAVLSDLLPKLYDRHSREAVLTIATAAHIGFGQGKIFIAKHLADKLAKDFSVIEQYPDTDESRAAGSSFRAMAPMLLLNKEDPAERSKAEWLEYFWDQVAGYGTCVLEANTPADEAEPDNILEKIIVRFRKAARKEFRERIEKWKFDLGCVDKRDSQIS